MHLLILLCIIDSIMHGKCIMLSDWDVYGVQMVQIWCRFIIYNARLPGYAYNNHITHAWPLETWYTSSTSMFIINAIIYRPLYHVTMLNMLKGLIWSCYRWPWWRNHCLNIFLNIFWKLIRSEVPSKMGLNVILVTGLLKLQYYMYIYYL